MTPRLSLLSQSMSDLYRSNESLAMNGSMWVLLLSYWLVYTCLQYISMCGVQFLAVKKILLLCHWSTLEYSLYIVYIFLEHASGFCGQHQNFTSKASEVVRYLFLQLSGWSAYFTILTTNLWDMNTPTVPPRCFFIRNILLNLLHNKLLEFFDFSRAWVLDVKC